MPIRLSGSPVEIVAQEGFREASQVLQGVAYKFATGEKFAKPSENIFASVEASIGRAQLTYTESALSTLTRLASIIATRTGSLNVMMDGVLNLSNIALQAAGSIDGDVRAANVNVFNLLLSRVSNIAATAEYAGIKLLNGSFGTAGAFAQSNANVNNVSPVVSAALTYLEPHLDKATGTITTTGVLANDTLTIGGVTFTYVATNPSTDPQAHQILIGNNDNATAKSTLLAINRASDDGLKAYAFNLATPTGSIINVTHLANTIAVDAAANYSSSNGRVGIAYTALANAGATQAFDTTKLTGTTGQALVGTVSNISLSNITSANTQRAVWLPYEAAMGYTAPVWAGAVNAADTLCKFTFTVGGTSYNAYHFTDMSNAGAYAASAASQELLCIKTADDTVGATLTGKVFAVQLAAGVNLGTAATQGANLAGFMAGFDTDAAKLTFKQQNYIGIDTTAGDIQVNNVAVGTVNGMTAILNSSVYTGLQVSSVAATATNITVNMTGNNGLTRTFIGTVPATGVLEGGSQVVLTDAASADTLTLGLGTRVGLNLSTVANQTAISQALQNALGSTAASNFIVGPDVTQVLSVNLNNMSWTTLTGGQTLSIATPAQASVASTVLSGVVDAIEDEIALTAAYDVSVTSLTDQMVVSKQNLAASISELSDLDIAATRQDLDTALRVYTSCIASMMADNKANKLLEQLLMVN